MVDETIKSDANRVNVAAGVTNDANQNIVQLRVDPTTKRLLVDTGSSSGTASVVGIKDASDTRINPAKEDGNLASIKAKTDNLDVLLSTRATENTLLEIKAGTDKIPVHPATEDGNLAKIPGLAIPIHDYIGLTYTGSNLTQVVYKQGGASGTIVATLTLAYDTNNNLISVTKS